MNLSRIRELFDLLPSDTAYPAVSASPFAALRRSTPERWALARHAVGDLMAMNRGLLQTEGRTHAYGIPPIDR